MQTTTAVANGANEVERIAARDADAVQDAVNLVAIVGAWHRDLLEMHRAGICGDNLINHPVNLAFVSKLNSLCRMNFDREMAALSAIDKIEQGEAVEYEVVPLWQVVSPFHLRSPLTAVLCCALTPALPASTATL